ncbi:MAG: MarR family transcriptional regulator [Planctomycetes bacterium]|nr:MarR family transcriptional regulator [Planctomycetota bacterium]
MRAVDLHSRRLVDEFGFTGPQLMTLREAQRRGPISAGALARAVHLSSPTLTGILGRLEKRGLIERTRGADRRTLLVQVTELGAQTLARAPSLLQDRFRAALSELATWERLMMLSNLQRIAAMMDAEGLDAAPHLEADARAFEQVRDPTAPTEPPANPPPEEPFRRN